MLKKGLIALLGTATCSLIVNHAPVQAYDLLTNVGTHETVKCSLEDFTGASDCRGSFTLGNGVNDVTSGGSEDIVTKMLNEHDIFGDGAWTFGLKEDMDKSPTLFTKGAEGVNGTFDISSFLEMKPDVDVTEIAISLKASKGFSLYRVTKDSWGDLAKLDWSTFGTSRTNGNRNNPDGKAQALSHASVYYRFTTSNNNGGGQKVPEPASGLALLAIGAVAAKSVLRKKNAEASSDE